MVNSSEFIKRLEKIIEYYGLSASSFSDKIGVQRSSISHILSGRNKPSLDFVMKILSSFPEVDLYWLLNGKGTFPKKEISKDTSHSETQIMEKADFNQDTSDSNKKIQRIVFFYSDGSFESFES